MGIFFKLKSCPGRRNLRIKRIPSSQLMELPPKFLHPFGSKQFNRTGIFRIVTRILVIISFRAQRWRNMFRAFNRAETLAAWERESWHTRRRMQTTYSRTHTSVLFVREGKRTNSYTRRGEEGLFFLAFSGPALEALNRFTCYDGLETWSNSIHNSYTCFWTGYGSMNNRRGIGVLFCERWDRETGSIANSSEIRYE